MNQLLNVLMFVCLIPITRAISQSNITNIQLNNGNQSTDSMFDLIYKNRLLYQLRDRLNSFEHTEQWPVTSQCLTTLEAMLKFTTKYSWGMKMLDANAPIPSGLQNDQFTSVGGFDQCMSIAASHNELNFVGRYCIMELRFKNNIVLNRNGNKMNKLMYQIQNLNQRFPIALGLCFPSTCSSNEINHLMNSYFYTQQIEFRSKINSCQSLDNYPNSLESFVKFIKKRNLLISFSIVMIASILTILGTSYDLLIEDKTTKTLSTIHSILLCFSIIRNTSILCANRQTRKPVASDKSEKQSISIECRLSHLHGLRALLITWIMVSHSCALMPASIVMPISMVERHPHDMLKLAKGTSLLSNFFNNSTLAVEAFFFISGLLLITLVISKNLLERINFTQFILFRWIRFAPALLGMVVIQKCTILFGSGPFFSESMLNQSVLKSCHDNEWWKSFLFINNWMNLSDTCLPISWFLSVDVQIHILAFVLIIILRQRHYPHASLLVTFCIGMILFSTGILFIFLLMGVKTFENMNLFVKYGNFPIQSYVLLYSGTHVHLAAYFYGVLIGYILINNRRLVNDQRWKTFIWWSSVIIVLSGPLIRTPSIEQVNHIVKGLTIGIFHTIWLLSFGLMCYFMSQIDQCASAIGSTKQFLSATIFGPISRLSFSMYLSHMTTIWFNVYNRRSPLDVDGNNMYLFGSAMMIETTILAYLLFIMFECPSVNLMKLLLNSNHLSNISGKKYKLNNNEEIHLNDTHNTKQEFKLNFETPTISNNNT